MKISKNQWDALEKASEASFVDRLLDYIREQPNCYPPALSDEQLREMVKNGIQKARQYELTQEYSISMFVGLMFKVAPNFDEYPPIHSCLKTEDIPPNERIQLLLDTIEDRQWQQALASYDPAAWGIGNLEAF